MSAENVEIARRGMEAWNRGDVEAMLETSAPEMEFTPAIAGGVEGGSVRGHDEFRSFFANLSETWESFRIEGEEFRDLGDHVLVLGRVRAKGRGSGAELDQPIFSVIWFREEMMIRMDTFLDQAAALEAAKEAVR